MTELARPAVGAAVNPTRIVHYEHPQRKGEAWCGAPVNGTYEFKPTECQVCVDLWRGTR